MPSKRVMRKEIIVAKATKELQDLINQEVRMEGNAFAPVLFVKGADFTPDELTALRASGRLDITFYNVRPSNSAAYCACTASGHDNRSGYGVYL